MQYKLEKYLIFTSFQCLTLMELFLEIADVVPQGEILIEFFLTQINKYSHKYLI